MASETLTEAELAQFNPALEPPTEPESAQFNPEPSGYTPSATPKRPGFEPSFEDTRTGPAAFRRAFQQENLISLLAGGAEDNRLADLYAITEAAGRKIDPGYNVEEDPGFKI